MSSWQADFERWNRKALGRFIEIFDCRGRELDSGDLVSVEFLLERRKLTGRILWNEGTFSYAIFSSFLGGNSLDSENYAKILVNFKSFHEIADFVRLEIVERIREHFSGSDFK